MGTVTAMVVMLVLNESLSLVLYSHLALDVWPRYLEVLYSLGALISGFEERKLWHEDKLGV